MQAFIIVKQLGLHWIALRKIGCMDVDVDMIRFSKRTQVIPILNIHKYF